MVPEAGLEPAHPYERGILNPLCLPISPPGHGFLKISDIFFLFFIFNGAGNEVRTRDPNLGKVVLYH